MPERFGEQFLHQKNSKLHTSEQIENTQRRRKERGQEISQKPAEKLGAYLDRLESILQPEPLEDHEDFDRRSRNVELLKQKLYEDVIIDPEDIPESYFEHQREIAREQGHGDIEITEELREQSTEVIISDQESTLDNWVDYLTSEDADSYPMWAKYFAFTGMLKLSSYDKETHRFAKRKKDTVAPFPDLNREALAYVVDAVNKKANQEEITQDDPEFQSLIQGANFGKLYAYAIEKVTPAEEDELLNTEGQWVKYDQNSDHMPLVESLQGHGTGWCTAGESTAQSQLSTGDFYVYYSKDQDGNPTIPRSAIRMQEGQIAEVRGIAKEQNLDPYITDVVKEKLGEFPDGEIYEKKTQDMERLTQIEKKTKNNQLLTKEELTFLYEVDSIIQGFGYQKDPRIEELRGQRNIEEDILVIFECEPDQIIHSQNELEDATKQKKEIKAYVGELFLNIFQLLPQDLEHIYTSFPEGKIKRIETTIGGESKEDLIEKMNSEFKVSDNAMDMLQSEDFTTQEEKEDLTLIRLKVSDLGFKSGATTEELYTKAEELGLELCPAETGPQLRKQYLDQPENEYLRIAMKQIAASDGYPNVFYLYRDTDDLWLYSRWARPGSRWDPDDEFVFRLRQVFPET